MDIGALLISRAILIYPFILIQKIINKDKSIPFSWSHILFWGGLKGSISIALVIGMPDFEYRNLFIIAISSIVLFSLLFQGLTTKSLVKFLGIAET